MHNLCCSVQDAQSSGYDSIELACHKTLYVTLPRSRQCSCKSPGTLGGMEITCGLSWFLLPSPDRLLAKRHCYTKTWVDLHKIMLEGFTIATSVQTAVASLHGDILCSTPCNGWARKCGFRLCNWHRHCVTQMQNGMGLRFGSHKKGICIYLSIYLSI